MYMEGESSNVKGSSSAMNRILLKYRPIVPKPFTGSVALDKLPKRTKRRYVRRNRMRSAEDQQQQQRVETLQLLPMEDKSGTSSGGGVPHAGGGSSFESSSDVGDNNNDQWLGLSLSLGLGLSSGAQMGRSEEVESVADPSAEMDRSGGVESWVTVECVTGTCMTSAACNNPFSFSAVDLLRERTRLRLESDTCPGFISDGGNRVQWVNSAFKKLTMTSSTGEVTVWLWMNEELPYRTNDVAFTCQVKLKYTAAERRNKQRYVTQLVPCDLWRIIDGGGFAWRLNVKYAVTTYDLDEKQTSSDQFGQQR